VVSLAPTSFLFCFSFLHSPQGTTEESAEMMDYYGGGQQAQMQVQWNHQGEPWPCVID
jgi:hypothetical protein